jgi:hypothetical protein
MNRVPLDRPVGVTRPPLASKDAAENAGASRQPPARRPVQPGVFEIGGPRGPEPTRYGDWEKGGRCTDF